MNYQHAMIQVLAVQDRVMVAIVKDDCMVGLNCTQITPAQWDIWDEFTYTENGTIRLINRISPYLGESNFSPDVMTQKDFDAIDEAKIAHELGVWLDRLEKKNSITELQPLTIPIKILVTILHGRSGYNIPGFDLIKMMKELIELADYLLRQNLAENGIELSATPLTFDEHVCSAALAAEMAICYYETMVTAFARQFSDLVEDRCRCLVKG